MALEINPDDISSLLRECAAEYILPRYKLLKKEHIETKSGPNDLVTIADRETEEALDRALTKMFPESVVIGEEGVSAGKKSVSVLQDRSKVVWVVDPVDGTSNFVHGQPIFAVMLACVIDGRTQWGWIYDLPGNRMMVAERGGGAFIDGSRLKIKAGDKPLSEVTGHAGSRYFPAAMRPILKSYKEKLGKVHTLSCAGHEYLRLVEGKADFAIYSRIRPWDHLAGALAVTEAGGAVAKWDGHPYTPQDDFGGLIVASNVKLQETLRQTMIGDMLNEYSKAV